MRKRIHRKFNLASKAIEEVDLSAKSRHQLTKLLRALQYIYMHPKLREPILDIIENKVNERLKNIKVGKEGMSCWEILVLGVARLNLNIDYDFLQDLSNNHMSLRGILGVSTVTNFNPKLVYKLQTIKDNVGWLDEACLKSISEIVVKSGHQIIQKKEQKQEEKQEQKEQEVDLSKQSENNRFSIDAKVDSFVVLGNVHFPTDLNLLWDCGRKVLDTIVKIVETQSIPGFREHKGLLNKVRNAYRDASEIHRKKGHDYKNRLKISCTNYLGQMGELNEKLQSAKVALMVYATSDIKHKILVEQLYHYWHLMKKHIDLVNRRILQDEKIPHEDKMFSIFEPYVKWLYKGKAGGLVELGLNTNIATCQHHFILWHKVMDNEVDVDLTIPTANNIAQIYGEGEGYFLNKISFDKNYYASLAKQGVEKVFANVIMPKKGKKNLEEQEAENEEEFKAGLRQHSAVESNINSLEHHGLDKCPDRSIAHFKRYVALGVLSYNLSLLGGLL